MIQELLYINSPGNDPYGNQAIEEHLLRRARPGEMILYLWQNQRTVVLGRNQNCWRECRVEELRQDGGLLARRLSGGGAVYHDLGNLNFTFCSADADHEVSRQLTVIQEALAQAGIATEKSGRNDILAGGRKFCGNAYYRSGGRSLHHGTLMVDVDMELLSRYLLPSRAKLAAKGVDSVRSRVMNLGEAASGLTIDKLRQLLIAALGKIYGGRPQELVLDEDDQRRISEYRQDYADWDWIYSPRGSADIRLEQAFCWGELQLELRLERGCIIEALAYSDAMDSQLILAIGAELEGCRYQPEEMTARLQELGQRHDAAAITEDICQWLREAV